MAFDEEELDPHGECRHEIERLRAALEAVNRLASTNPVRTFDHAIRDLEMITDTARAALAAGN